MESRKIFLGGEFLIHDAAAQDVFVPEEFSEEHTMFFRTASEFIRKEVIPNLERIEAQDESLIRSLFRKAGEIGLNGTDVPEECGGLELDKISSCVVAEAVGNGASFAVSHANHTGISTIPIAFFGTDEQKQKYLPRLASGEWIGAYCLTEANAGSDALNCRTRAVLAADGRHYVLNGEKMFITNSAWADSFVVYAKVDGTHFTAFIVERTFPGISFGAEEKKMGIKGSSTRQVILQDCPVPIENVILEVGQGHKVAFNALNIGRYKMGAFVLGGCKTSIAESSAYANTRVQFGKPISSFGLIKQKLADMAIYTFAAESVTYRVAAMIDDRLSTLSPEERKDGLKVAAAVGEYASECSICKVFGSECLDLCADEWVQILGGYGYCQEYHAERAYRDSRINRIFEGTNEINRLLIPGTLLKRALQGRLDLLGASQRAAQELAELSPDSIPSSDDNLAREAKLLRIGKDIAVLSTGVSARKFMAQLNDEQEVLGLLADMCIELFAAESILVRAKKVESTSGGKRATYAAAVGVYVDEALPQLVRRADKILSYVKEGEGCAELRSALDKVRMVKPLDTVSLKRKIADKVIELERYPFGR